MIHRLLTIFLLIASIICKGLDNGPEILRICLDNNNSIATIYWHSAKDNCNSFKYYKLYSSENNGPWILKTTISVINTIEYPVFIPDLTSDWRFKIVTYTSCNGIDSFISNPQSIDQNKPSVIELDSVSFDYGTQNLSAGWNSNPAADTKGYRLYHYISPVYDKILDTSTTFVTFKNYDQSNPTKIAIATYDSCDNYAPISNDQQAAYLTGKIDTCAKSIYINWTTYQGWTNIKQYLIENLNNKGFAKSVSLAPSGTNHTISNITLGDSVCFYIRTENILTRATSSSNTICFYTRKIKDPKINYLSNITIENNTLLKGYFIADNKADIDSFYIDKQEAELSFNPFLKMDFDPNKSNYSFEDINANFNNYYYSYRVKTTDKCNNITSISNIGRSIHLSKPILNGNLYEFRWNLYKDWEKGVSLQSIEISPDRFTWNLLKNESINNTLLSYSSKNITSDSLCFRINNIETLNSNNTSAVSTSNVNCIFSVGEFYFPKTINPYSNNNIFKIYGKGLDLERGLIQIYNRWGEKIYETNKMDEGWNGKIEGEFVMQGSYLYKATFYDERNKYYLKTGTILIIR